jgi:sialidase-1
MKQLARLLLFLCSSMLGMSAQADVFSLPVWENTETSYHNFRIPSVIVSTKGTVLAFCEGRGAHGDSGNIDLIMKRSTDNGQTWSEQAVVWSDGENTCGNPCPVVDEETGRITLLMTWNHGESHEDNIMADTALDTRRPYVCYSDDDGLTWSKPKDIAKQAKVPEWGWYATGPGFGIQLKSEKYKGRIIIPANHSYDTDDVELQIDGGQGYGAHVLISDDGGEAWRMSEPIRPNCNESQVVELSDGTLMMNMRSYSGLHCRAYSYSYDGGETWSEVRQALQLVEPRNQGSIIKFGEYQDKTMYLFSNAASVATRAAMSVKASFDDCTSWSNMKLVSGERAQYSCLTVLPNGNVGLLYEIGGSDWSDLGIRFISFPADELFKPGPLLDNDPQGYGFEPVLQD